MPVRNLKPLKAGYVRVGTLINKGGNRAVKVGGKAYNNYVDRRTYNNVYFTEQEVKKTRFLRKTLPTFYSQDVSFKNVVDLMKNEFVFSKSDTNVVRNLLNKIRGRDGKQYLINFKLNNGVKKSLTLNDITIGVLTNALTNGYFSAVGDVVYNSGSDAFNMILTIGIKSAEIKEVEKRKRFFKSGKFFRYYNTTDIDLEKYQIINEQSDKKILNDHCLTYCLKQYGVSNELNNRIKTTFEKGTHFAKKNFIEVCNIIKKNINLHWYNKNNEKRIQRFNKKYDETIDIALYEEHYFIYEKTMYSRYASKNYNLIKDEKDFHNIHRFHKDSFERNENLSKTTSLDLIKNLLESGMFNKDNIVLRNIDEFQKYNDVDDTLELIDEEQREFQFRTKEEQNQKFNKKTIVFYADTETDVSNDEGHEPILLAYTSILNPEMVHTFTRKQYDDTGEDLYKEFMISIYNKTTKHNNFGNVIIYFHNLKYDYNVLKGFMYVIGAPTEKDGQLYEVKVMFRKKIFTFRDSLKLTNMRLDQFNKAFGLPEKYNKKEAINYDYYTKYNINDFKTEVEVYTKGKDKEWKETFRKNLELDLFNYEKVNGIEYFDAQAYYKYYLKYDVLILQKGLEKFNDNIKEIVKRLDTHFDKENNINLFDFLTISSLTKYIFSIYGSFDGMYEVNGNLRKYLSNFVTGGRVEVNEHYIKKVIEQKIADYDGVSLYPSAIDRLCREQGLPLGKAQTIKTTDKKELDKLNYYMVKIKITKINKYQQLPMVSYKDDTGILRYINVINEPIISYVDMITLNDWIEFQGIEYEIINGVYWNEGYNNKMGEVMNILFNDRLKFKKKKNNSMQEILKLMMNSSYGKTITKLSKKTNIVVDNDKKEQFIADNFNNIIEIKLLNQLQSVATITKLDSSYNMSHVGCFILSYSKRIMNEVFNVANDNKCTLYYTDTDSIHCNYDDVVIIEEGFRKVYNRELTGKNMGQFHIDFKMKDAEGEIYATKSIFLGKKCYIDKLQSIDEDGKIINDYHYRMKGVNEQGIVEKARKEYNNDVWQVYEELSKGKEIEFVLNPEGGKPNFEYFDLGIKTRETNTFVRSLKF